MTCHAATEPKSDRFWCKVFNHALQIAAGLKYHKSQIRSKNIGASVQHTKSTVDIISTSLAFMEWSVFQEILKVCTYKPRGHIFDIPLKEQMKIWIDANSPQVFEHFGSPRSLSSPP